ncbi:SUI1 family translation initiation factor [Natronobiforma cellulositropha]|uniref:translation initiation factor n=1 Tax=Natronobiforma cellulositropha TaxID=1679076 RepID=UPI0021D5CEDF|nr:translation initiation factor [Natronobiforma cellulositropha]
MADDDPLDDLLEELDAHDDLTRTEQAVSVRMERRRYGKPMTILEGFDLPRADVRDLASELKRSLGTGGTAEEGRIELQGDHQRRVPELLRDRGFTVRE